MSCSLHMCHEDHELQDSVRGITRHRYLHVVRFVHAAFLAIFLAPTNNNPKLISCPSVYFRCLATECAGFFCFPFEGTVIFHSSAAKLRGHGARVATISGKAFLLREA